jgi:hypothetical protein
VVQGLDLDVGRKVGQCRITVNWLYGARLSLFVSVPKSEIGSAAVATCARERSLRATDLEIDRSNLESYGSSLESNGCAQKGCRPFDFVYTVCLVLCFIKD